MGGRDGRHRLVRGCEPLVQSPALLRERVKELLAQGGSCVLLCLQRAPKGLRKFGHAWGQDNPLCHAEPTPFVHECGPGFPDPLAGPMERREIVLGHCLDGDKAHGGPRHRFTDRFGITWGILRRLDRGLHTLWSQELRGMPMRAEAACPIMGASTGFHPDDCGRQRRDKRHQGFACQTFAQHDIPLIIHSHKMKNPLC
jgi:hypothetical protein